MKARVALLSVIPNAAQFSDTFRISLDNACDFRKATAMNNLRASIRATLLMAGRALIVFTLFALHVWVAAKSTFTNTDGTPMSLPLKMLLVLGAAVAAAAVGVGLAVIVTVAYRFIRYGKLPGDEE